jgi:hypothetical protein
MSDNDFSTLFIKNIDQCIINYDNIIVMGDLNFDMLSDKKCQALKDLCDVLQTLSLFSYLLGNRYLCKQVFRHPLSLYRISTICSPPL